MSGYQPSTDARVGKVVQFGAVLVVLIVVSFLATFALFRLFSERADQTDVPASPLAGSAPAFPSPELQADPTADRIQLQQEEDARLSGYGWVDRRQRLVHIPIERAMDLAAERDR